MFYVRTDFQSKLFICFSVGYALNCVAAAAICMHVTSYMVSLTVTILQNTKPLSTDPANSHKKMLHCEVQQLWSSSCLQHVS